MRRSRVYPVSEVNSSALMSNAYMASDVERAYAPRPDFLAFKFASSNHNCAIIPRSTQYLTVAGVGKKTQDQSGRLITRVLRLRLRHPDWRMHHTPI